MMRWRKVECHLYSGEPHLGNERANLVQHLRVVFDLEQLSSHFRFAEQVTRHQFEQEAADRPRVALLVVTLEDDLGRHPVHDSCNRSHEYRIVRGNMMLAFACASGVIYKQDQM